MDHPGNVVVFNHPLISHKLSYLRDAETGHRPFRALMRQIAGLMVYEVTRTFQTVGVEVNTPLGPMMAERLAHTITIVPVLRAGLGMTEGVLDLLPEARVGHLGLARDEQTLEPKAYLNKLPDDLNAGPVVLIDPMLATGGSAVAAVRMLREAGAEDLRMICLVAAPEGIERLTADQPGVRIYAAAVDERLDENGFIRPGLGDAGDRLFGTD